MDYSEYIEKRDEIDEEAKKKKQDLAIEYAKANRVANIGDTVTDGNITIVVKQEGVYISHDEPKVKYLGPRLKKDLTPYKSGESDFVYEGNGIKILKKASRNEKPE